MPKKSNKTSLDQLFKKRLARKHVLLGLVLITAIIIGIATNFGMATSYYNAANSTQCRRHSGFSSGRYVFEYLGHGRSSVNGTHYHKYRRWNSIQGTNKINIYYGCKSG